MKASRNLRILSATPNLDPGEQSKDAVLSIRATNVEDSAAPLRDAWYYAAPSRAVRRSGMLARKMLGEPVLLGRDRAGGVFALRDICPHRGMPLSEGGFDGSEIECCYHGWRFTTDGRCTAIPSLVEGQDFDLGRKLLERLIREKRRAIQSVAR